MKVDLRHSSRDLDTKESCKQHCEESVKILSINVDGAVLYKENCFWDKKPLLFTNPVQKPGDRNILEMHERWIKQIQLSKQQDFGVDDTCELMGGLSSRSITDSINGEKPLGKNVRMPVNHI